MKTPGPGTTPFGTVVLCADSPLRYSSPNAPQGRDVLGTLVVSIINGQTRYAHIGALRGDRVSAEVFGVS